MKKKSIFLQLLAALLILPPFYYFLYQIYLPRISAFGCFDDCFNYLGGYFLGRGKTLYSEIFFNHQPLMAYFSNFIQSVTQPGGVYELLLRHRQVIILFSFLANVSLVLRFGWPALGFAVFFESSKFYLFGDRFLAEGVAVYFLAYLVGLAWIKLLKRKLYPGDYLLASVFAFLVIFSRLPLAPLALTAFLFLMESKPFSTKVKKVSWGILGVLVILIMAQFPLKDYFFNLISVNQQTGRLSSFNLLKSFFYPIWLLVSLKKGLFPEFLWGLNFLFLISLVFLKDKKKILFIFLSLGLVNLIIVPPGEVFYGAFHLLPWFGLFVFFLFLMLSELFRKKKGFVVLTLLLLGFFGFSFVSSPYYFAREEVVPHEEFLIHFGHQIRVGEVFKTLSKPADSLFLDGFDDLIYYQADRLSDYPYAWYTSVMPRVPQYAQARLEMFAQNPPDLYYGSCPDKEVEAWTMPKEYLINYDQFSFEEKPTCLWIHKEKIPEVSQAQWQGVKEQHYQLKND